MNQVQRGAEVLADPRWVRLQRRDPSADGVFYFGVESTGVYCKPTCKSRAPKPENVHFFDSPAAAEAAGFRACRRCEPNVAPKQERQAQAVAELCRWIEEAEVPPKLAELAARVGWSVGYTQRTFLAITGLTPKAYAAARRVERAKVALSSQATVTEAIYAAGFLSSSRFYEGVADHLGMKPSEYRSGGKNLIIDYAIGPCRLGQVLVAATPRGVCAILLGDDQEPLKKELAERFPKAQRVPAPEARAALLAQVVALVDHPAAGSTLPLDIQGTAFQRRVWAVLQTLAPGQVTTYSELAARIGAPKAVRAVAGACGKNPVAVAVPCHRVIGGDGKLTGYRWGLARKQQLLELEGAKLGEVRKSRPK
ncbi:MAG: bifunctional DNA-binding transcriptional regulator/O6-methylguanine-DNA methyltransferase Ada [Deltaproteobacteria bacterium]|jgi:AraC family transcriptional regulator of adaptative response/methylated-DNA-[protein]-cysteine methyltransferase|nr:bifunctional DNA-binding transcriptional regulator/O6-methylguanine-DNA methyltransferase Ada [Deltaproteobacteria bacterium]